MKTSSMFVAWSLALSAGVVLGGCSYLAERTAPAKQASTSRTEASVNADELFWQTFHAGRYEEIPTALQVLTGAYLANPNDAITASHVAWLHIWRLGESARLDQVPPTITDDAVLARRYFQEAVNLDTHEPRYLGFLAAAVQAEGSIHKDEKLTRRGYYLMLDAIDAWPEFNLFTGGYVASRLPADSKQFKQALQWQWKDLDACVNAKVDRTNPDFARYMALETTEGHKRACWNSWIAPHNFEGFFMNMGDMLVKSGDWQTAKIIYADARLSSTYQQWKFRDVLEERIADAQVNVAVFNAAPPGADKSRQRMMIATPFACMACHQQ